MPAGAPPPAINLQWALAPAFANAMRAVAVIVRRSDPIAASILTAHDRKEASPEFLNCCGLLMHHVPWMALMVNQLGTMLASQSNLFPRQPTEHFLHNVLGPLHASAAATGYTPVFYNYVEALLSCQGILIEAAYSKVIFTAEQARALVSVKSWAMSAASCSVYLTFCITRLFFWRQVSPYCKLRTWASWFISYCG
jgi:hypothetical protein